VNGKTIVYMENSWDATVMGMYSLLKSAWLCDCEVCGFCVQVRDQDQLHMLELLRSDDAARNHFPIDKQSSDNTNQFLVSPRTSSAKKSRCNNAASMLQVSEIFRLS
jgi:hypothetical protein